MTHPAPQINPTTFPKVPATRCACCGIGMPTGYGYLVPYIGEVGPRCRKKFVAFAQLIDWVEGRASAPAADRESALVANNLIAGLRCLGFHVEAQDGVLHVLRLTRKPAEVATSWKRTRARFELDLQRAAGLFGDEQRQASAQEVAA